MHMHTFCVEQLRRHANLTRIVYFSNHTCFSHELSQYFIVMLYEGLFLLCQHFPAHDVSLGNTIVDTRDIEKKGIGFFPVPPHLRKVGKLIFFRNVEKGAHSFIII